MHRKSGFFVELGRLDKVFWSFHKFENEPNIKFGSFDFSQNYFLATDEITDETAEIFRTSLLFCSYYLSHVCITEMLYCYKLRTILADETAENLYNLVDILFFYCIQGKWYNRLYNMYT